MIPRPIPRSKFRHPMGIILLAGAVGVTCGTLVGLGTFLFERQYRATARFTPESGTGNRLPGGLSDLASQFILGIGSQGIKPLQYYSVVLRSDAVLDHVLDAESPLANHAGTLAHYFATRYSGGEVPPREKARRWLRNRVAVTTDNRATTMELSVTLPDRDVAAAAANRFLTALNDFNSLTRASQAKARREYLERVLLQQRDSLRQAEDSLLRFLQRNRLYKDSPALEFQYTRLKRQVDMNQEIVSTVQRDLEAARLDEINETPILSVIDSAKAPLRSVSPNRRLSVTLSFVIGAIGTLYLAVLAYTEARPRPTLPHRIAWQAARTDRWLRRNQRTFLPNRHAAK